MEIVGSTGLVSVAWFPILLIVVLVLAVVTKSLLANLGLVLVGVLGLEIMQNLYGVEETVRYGLIALMVCLMAFAVFQMITKVEHI